MFQILLNIQLFFELIYQSIISFLRVLLRFRFSSGFKNFKTGSGSIIILANGPSLKKDLEQYGENISRCTTMGVNFFAISDAFTKIKPSYYTILDINFFREDKILDRVRESREKLIDSFNKNLNWEMTMCIPAEGKNSPFHLRLRDSGLPFKFVFFNRTSITGFKALRNSMYSKGWGMPPPQNVLIGAIMSSIHLGFRNIYTLGADHSWHEEISVDQEGTFKITDKHFYNTEGKTLPKHHGESLKQFAMSDFFQELAKTFRSHMMVNDFACRRGVKIFNASSKSYIDAYILTSISELDWDQLFVR